MTDRDSLAYDVEHGKFVGEMIGAATTATSFMVVAVVAALIERGPVDPSVVASIADELADKNCSALPPITGQITEGALRNMAEMLRSMATVPPNAGHA